MMVYSFPTWVKMLGQMIVGVIVPIIVLVFALLLLYRNERVHQAVKTFCIAAAVFVCSLYCFLAMFFILLESQEERLQIQSSGKRYETEREEHVPKPSENVGKEEDKTREKIPETEQETERETELEMEQEPEADYRETAARAVYDAVLLEEGFSYEVYYNAKGNLYIELGTKTSEEDGRTYSYSLVYDRPSKNGACELLVLYRTAEGSENEAIVDMYAVETVTGKVVASGRKAWSDVGTKEYREMTGE